jgi:hypothetical protein
MIVNELLYFILEYSEEKNLFYINKNFYNYIKKIREQFVDDPITIKFKLSIIKKKVYENLVYRPSFRVGQEEEFILEKKYLGIKLGTIDKKIITPSKILEDILIPVSKYEDDLTIFFGGTVMYFELYLVYTDDEKKFKKYCLIYN